MPLAIVVKGEAPKRKRGYLLGDEEEAAPKQEAEPEEKADEDTAEDPEMLAEMVGIKDLDAFRDLLKALGVPCK